MNPESLDDVVGGPTRTKVGLVDTLGNQSYCLIVGAAIDYMSGMSPAGVLASRCTGIVMNAATAAPYGWWREKVYGFSGTNEESGNLRKTLTELLAFNIFQVPGYAAVLAIANFISEGEVDSNKLISGMTNLAVISPFIAPTMGLYMDFIRKLFGVKSAAAYAQAQSSQNSNTSDE